MQDNPQKEKEPEPDWETDLPRLVRLQKLFDSSDIDVKVAGYDSIRRVVRIDMGKHRKQTIRSYLELLQA